MKKIKIILLTGFLGSGKSSFLSGVLQDREFSAYKTAVVVNDFASVNIDSTILPSGDYHLEELNNGNIFCACMKTSLIKIFSELLNNHKPDFLFIEASGIAEPGDLSSIFDSKPFTGRFEIFKKVCIVDALNFLKLVQIMPAISAQVSDSELILLNKTDLADNINTAEIKNIIRKINSKAEIIKTKYGKIQFEKLLDPCRKNQNNGKLKEINCRPPKTYTSVLRSKQKLNKTELYSLLDEFKNSILRLKGYMDFNDGIFFVEIVNGEIFSKKTRESQKRETAVIYTNSLDFDKFQKRCEKTGFQIE